MDELQKQAAQLVEQAHKQGKAQGLYEGLLLAERIHRWYAENYKLAVPIPAEELDRWTQAALTEHRNKM